MSGLPAPKRGEVIRYKFVWPEEEEPEKTRPCAVAAALQDGKVMVLPITHASPYPAQAQTHIFIPDEEKRLANLDGDPQWIVIDVQNYFPWPSDDVATGRDGRTFIMGSFSDVFFREVLVQLKKLREEGVTTTVKR